MQLNLETQTIAEVVYCSTLLCFVLSLPQSIYTAQPLCHYLSPPSVVLPLPISSVLCVSREPSHMLEDTDSNYLFSAPLGGWRGLWVCSHPHMTKKVEKDVRKHFSFLFIAAIVSHLVRCCDVSMATPRFPTVDLRACPSQRR